jgi:Serine incorporator (Serinc)
MLAGIMRAAAGFEPSDKWFGQQAVYRISMGSCLYFAALSAALLGVRYRSDARGKLLQHGHWGLKLGAWLAFSALPFFFPNGVVQAYGTPTGSHTCMSLCSARCCNVLHCAALHRGITPHHCVHTDSALQATCFPAHSLSVLSCMQAGLRVLAAVFSWSSRCLFCWTSHRLGMTHGCRPGRTMSAGCMACLV